MGVFTITKIKWSRLFGVLAVAFVIFGLGWSAGSGKIGPDSIFRRSVNKKLPANLDYSTVEQVYDDLRTRYDGSLDVLKLLDGLKAGLVQAAGDAYTEFLDAEAVKSFNDALDGSFTGIGAELSKNPETKQIVVIAPITGFPAEKAGLRAQDIITEINGDSAANLSITEAVNKIRGDAGTTVKLTVQRGDRELSFTITRAKITVSSVESKTLEGKVGYIKISTFGNDTSDLANRAATDLKAKGIKAIILDLRDNPGGLLDGAIDVSSLWLNNKVVLFEKRGTEVIKTFRSDNIPVLEGLPTVVLVNQGSASASEIVAGALSDNKVATTIGEKSFGKGSVQQLIDLSGGNALKVTIAKWYTPGDKNIDKEGITPDKKVELTEEDFKNSRDPQLDAAIEFLLAR